MSGHLIGCAGALERIQITNEDGTRAEIELATSHKLALLAFADSGDDRTHIGFPGEEGVMKWAVCSRGRAYELIRDLVTWELLKQHKRGRRGQRAEYVVFPNGCCDIHRPQAEEQAPAVDAEQLAAAAGVSVDQARKMLAAMGENTAVQPDHDTAKKGSGAPDAMSGSVSDAPDANNAVQAHDDSEAVDNPGKGPDSVGDPRSTANAFTPSERISPYPAGKPAGSCAAHPNGHANCRDCGTSPRARRETTKRAAAAAARAAAQARLERERQARLAGSVPADDPAIQRRLQTVRDQLRTGKASA